MKNVLTFLSEWSYCAFSVKSSKRFVINFKSLKQSLFWQYFQLKNLSRCFVLVVYLWHWTHFVIPVNLMGLDNFKKESQITNKEKYPPAIVNEHILKSNFKYRFQNSPILCLFAKIKIYSFLYQIKILCSYFTYFYLALSFFYSKIKILQLTYFTCTYQIWIFHSLSFLLGEYLSI